MSLGPATNLTGTFLSGPNAPFIEELYAKYLENPSAVDPSWRKFFSELQDESEIVLQDIRGASGSPRARSVEIGNGDETTHNVHSLPDVNREFNFAQFVKGQKNVQTFTTAEVMVPLKCDLHGWMNAYIGVVDHPFFAVTREGGRFELKGLPPGTYTIEAWHAKAGTQTQQVTIGAKESKEITFKYGAPSAD